MHKTDTKTLASAMRALSAQIKLDCSTFFATGNNATVEFSATQTIRTRVDWAMTSRGGKQFDFLRMDDDGPACSSVYGLCE